MDLKEELKLVDIEHKLQQKLKAEIIILKVLLNIERKRFVPLQDWWEVKTLLKKYPDLHQMHAPNIAIEDKL
jgi:hypothetical protein